MKLMILIYSLILTSCLSLSAGRDEAVFDTIFSSERPNRPDIEFNQIDGHKSICLSSHDAKLLYIYFLDVEAFLELIDSSMAQINVKRRL